MPFSNSTRQRSAHSSPYEEVVISGLAGCYPESENVYKLRDNLFNKVDMVTEDDRRWKFDHPKLPKRIGKLPNVTKFDASFFGINYKQAHIMDPLCRLLLERTYEAIVDAGVNPCLLKGKRVGVFVGACFSETEKFWYYDKPHENGYGLTGCVRAMYANQISYWLGITGPSYAVDAACSSSTHAFELAYKAICSGHCDSAIVGSSQLTLHPYVALQFSHLGVLSPQGTCRVFDRDANGYVRSEATCVMFLQKARDAKRIYATVVNAKTNCDGFKDKGISHPSGKMQSLLLRQCCEECGVNPSSVEYCEAHGTATKVGDHEELKAMALAFCKERKTPLLVGSVKSNMGHSEGASGLCGITKVIIAMETGFIPPNLHYNNPREGVEELVNGQMKVVTEAVPWTGNLASVTSLGLGGANANIILQRNEKNKVNGGAPTDSIPRLVVASGRTKEAVDVILTDFESRPVDAEFVHLMQDLQSVEITGHKYRGYTLLTQDRRKLSSVKYYPGGKRPVWFVFTGIGSQWPGMGKSLLKLPVFAAAIDKCQQALKPYGVDVINIIISEDPRIFNNILNCFVGIAAFQIGLVDIMRAVGIDPDGFVGHSVGELCCSYMDGCFTAEQTVLAAYYLGRTALETELIKGSMVAVGLGAEQVKKLCPSDIEVACYIGHKFCMLSGPGESMKKFVKTLQQQGVWTTEVNCANTALHSQYISSAGPLVLKYLKQLIPRPKPRSPLWVSSSVPHSEWNSPLATHSSAEYHTNNLLNAVLFEEASRHIPLNAITVEIAPHGLLQAILNRSLNRGITNIALTQQGYPDCTEWLLTALGRLYELGLQPQLANLYPPIQYPVSRGTPMISPLVRWEHSEDWYVMYCMTQPKVKSGELSVTISLEDESMEYLSQHVIDGRNLFPATGYLELVWKSVGMMIGLNHTDIPIVFENVHFHRATNIPKKGSLQFLVVIQKGSGKFEIVEGNAAVVSGSVRVPANVSNEIVTLEPPKLFVDDGLLELSSQDIYRELRLCGYEYQGLFRGLVCADSCGRTGKVCWKNNWVAFLDSILQMKVFEDYSRGLFIPTFFHKLTLDPMQHAINVQELEAKNEDIVFPVYMYKELNIIKSAGVEVRGLKTSPITRRKCLNKPVLEKYVFTPNVEPAHMDLHAALRVCTHITVENKLGIEMKVVELHNKGTTPLSPALALILADEPLIKADITILAKAGDISGADLDKTGIKVEEYELESEQNCTLVIASNILRHTQFVQTAISALAEGAFILAREKPKAKITDSNGFRLESVFEKTLKDEKLLLLRKGVLLENPIVIHVTAQNYDWLPEVQTAIRSSSKRRIILVAQGEPLSGIVGLVKCIRKEPGSDFVRCFFILDTMAPLFDLTLPMYHQQLKKDLVMNIYRDGKWGSYRHLPLDDCACVTVPHACINIMTRGDLSSLKWMEGNLDPKTVEAKPNQELVHIYYSALNFRNVMTVTGKLARNAVEDRLIQDNVQGLEFSGRDQMGRRVMGIVPLGAFASMILADKYLLWDVPEHWTLEDAATVPVVYGTAYYALVMIGNLTKGKSVLIHSGAGGVGQAAINICLHAGCLVYTTVGTEEKRNFIKRQFPQLTDCNIGNSRDTSFEQLVMSETKGRGVDLILNSLAEQKLQASVRCLAPQGKFLEIGVFDIANNNTLGMEIFLKERSFHGVMLDKVITGSFEWKKKLHVILAEGIAAGVVRPLPRTVFADTEVEQAFRYMTSGKHIGKVLVQIRPEEDKKVVVPVPRLMEACPQYFCKPDCTYIIAGGLGGFGLELADWLVLRGARKLVLVSRTGVRTGYQSLCVRIWRSYGVEVVISVADITTRSGVRALLSEACKLGQVDAIFNLAVVLRDRLLENQTEADFIASAGPKALATHHLDVLSRQMCPHLRHFVVFSSLSSGRGHVGQTNYGMNNSIMERICEARVRDGLPALAVQWGAVGDVGLVAEMQEEQTDIQIGGTVTQKINSCLEVLDGFLKQSWPVVASMVVADKCAGSSGSGGMVACVANILGIRDLKTISPNSTLAELGLDSMTAVELKQTLEREFDLYLTSQEIRNLTFAFLEEMAANKQQTEVEERLSKGLSDVNEVSLEGLQLLLRVLGDEASAAQPVVRLPSATGTGADVEDEVKAGPVLFMLPGVEGMASILEPLAKNLKYQTVCLQLGYTAMGHTIHDLAQSLLPLIQNRLAPHAPFNLLGYSFGGLLALELAFKLEAEGHEGNLYLVDSGPDFMKALLESNISHTDEQFETNLLCAMLNIFAPHEARTATVSKLIQDITPLKSWDEKLDHFISKLPMLKNIAQHFKAIGISILVRLKAVSSYAWNPKNTLKCQTTLLRPSAAAVKAQEDYGLSKYCEKKVEVHFVTGNHVTMLDNKDTAAIINRQVTNTEALKFRNILSGQAYM